MAKISFEKRLERFKKNVALLMEDAQVLSEEALAHFIEHGQIGRLNDLYNAFPSDSRGRANFIRRVAFVKWACDHAPLVFSNGQFTGKDKSESAVEPNLKKAMEQPFWDYAPTPEAEFFGESDIVTALQRVITRFRGERFKPKDDKALDALSRAESVVSNMDKATMALAAYKPNDVEQAVTAAEELPEPVTQGV